MVERVSTWVAIVAATVGLVRPASGQPAEAKASPDLLSDLNAPLGLSLDEAMAAAALHAPTARRRRAQQAEAQADVDASTASLFPQPRLEASYRRLSDVDNPPLGPDQPGFAVIQNQWSVGTSLHWSLTNTVGAGLASLDAAEGVLEARASSAHAAVEQAKLDAAEVYLDAVQAEARLRLATASVRRVERLERDTAQQVKAGTARKSELSSVRASLARAQGDVVDAEATLLDATRRLTVLTGVPKAKSPRGLRLPQPRRPLPSFDTAVARADAKRSELKEARALVVATKATERATSLTRLPDLALEAAYRHARPNPRVTPPVDEWRSDWSLGVVLSWSPMALWTQGYQTQAARARTEQQRAAVDELKDGIRTQVSGAHARGRRAEAAMPSARAQLRAAEETYRLERRAHDEGVARARDVLDAEVELATAQSGLLEAYLESLRSRMSLRFVQGLPLAPRRAQSMKAPWKRRSR